MFAVVVTFTLEPADAHRFLELVKTNAAASLRDEPGCHRFDVCTDPDNRDEVFLYELYSDAAGFETHRETPHYKTFSAASAGMVSAKSVRTYADVTS